MRKRVRHAGVASGSLSAGRATLLRLAGIGFALLATILTNPAPASAIPAYPWSAVSEPVESSPASILRYVPAAPAFTMPDYAPVDADVGVSEVRPIGAVLVGDAEYILGLIHQYPWDADRAAMIAYCESGPDLWAEPWESAYVGTFQISAALHGWRGDVYSVEGNVAVAYQLWQEQGWRPWPICGYR